MKKIILIGSGGAGKSTLAKRLGEILNISVYHLDQYFWKPGWVPTPNDEWDKFLEELVRKEQWIIDGNFGRTLDIRLKEADTVIFLDMPRYITIYRIIKRRIMYHRKTRPDMNEGCNEKLDLEFIQWVWNFNRDKRADILKKIKIFSSNNKEIIILKRPAEVKKFLKSFH